MNKFPLAPSSLYDGRELIPFGLYDGLIGNPSTENWDSKGRIIKLRRTQRKAWVFMGVYSPEIICGMAIADAGLVTNAFAYFYSFRDKVFYQDSTLIPFGFPKNFDPRLDSDWKIGNYRISTEGGQMSFQYNGKFNLDISVALSEHGASLVTPSENNRPFNFTYKNVCLPVEVRLKHNEKTFDIKGNYGAIDFTKGYPPRKTVWNWCSLIGKTESGKSLGLNLVKHFNNEAENILWIENRKIVLSSPLFSLRKPLDTHPWQISTGANELNFELIPSGARSENTNLILMKSRFTQVFGKAEGVVKIDGQTEKFVAYGVAEDHLALW